MENINNEELRILKPTAAFIGASWVALALGAGAFCVGLWNSGMQLNEKGYYFTVLTFGLFATVSLQKSVRDKLEGLEVTNIYFGLCWAAAGIAIMLLVIGLWNANLELSEKGFFSMAFVLALFSSTAVQKNIRDLKNFPQGSTSSGIFEKIKKRGEKEE